MTEKINPVSCTSKGTDSGKIAVAGSNRTLLTISQRTNSHYKTENLK